jgi:hypothetical protein
MKHRLSTPRERGNNPRARGTNPRALGTNPRAVMAKATLDSSRAGELFTVTAEWIHFNATAGSGWTRASLAHLGIEWPPLKGWLAGLVGTRITYTQKANFERSCAAHHERRSA